MKSGNSVNEYGTPVSAHICEFCGREFTVCPPAKDELLKYWRGCLAPECESYDPQRDVAYLLESCQIKGLEKGDPPEEEATPQ